MLSALILVAGLPAARAEFPTEDRRAYDAWSLWTSEFDPAALPNAFTVELHGRPSYPNHPQGDYTMNVVRLEVVTESLQPDGSTITRTFAADVGGPEDFLEGRGGFRLGPCFDCTNVGGVLFFALPTTFGNARTIVDIHLSLPDAEGDCASAEPFMPCGGVARGYHNPSFGYPLYPGDDDKADALPWPVALA